MKQTFGKETYDHMEIPAELAQRVDEAIASVRREKLRGGHSRWDRRRWQPLRVCGAAAAAVLLCFTLALNTSTAFAVEMSRLPVIGPISRVLTIREITVEENDVITELKIPAIGLDSSLSDAVNARIQAIADQWIADAEAEFAEYREAFLATGGTEEEWADRDMTARVDYQVCYETEDMLSLELITEKCWVSAAQEHYFYNLDLKEDRELTLEDVLGPDYAEICNASIVAQIQERMAQDESIRYPGFGDDTQYEGFTTVTPETKFYLNAQGHVVVMFEKYEIAPGSMGPQTFEILP